MLYDDISQTIGRTPVVRIRRLGPATTRLYAKLEMANPGGSVKDRLALGILEVARRAPEGSVVLTLLPDTGERYLSTALFEGVETGSDAV